jgi:protein-arginine kinase activator protein McsA
MKCQHCEEAEAEVEAEIPMPKNGGLELLHLCIDCAIEAESTEIEEKLIGDE